MSNGWRADREELPPTDNAIIEMYLLLMLLATKVDGSALGKEITLELMRERTLLTFTPEDGVSRDEVPRLARMINNLN